MSDAFVRAFERGEIANADFRHASHLRLALGYLEESLSVDEAAARMASALRAFATVQGHPEKYHHTITLFWMRMMARLLDNARYLRQGFRDLGLVVIEPGKLPDGSEATTPVVPVVVGEDYQAALLWKALFDAGVYTNVAMHPAVPPGGALLRTSLMATHERSQLDRALGIIDRTIADFPDLPRA